MNELIKYLDDLRVSETNLSDDLNMVPSENRMSRYARIPFLLDIYNRYMFAAADDSPDGWHFRGGHESASYEFRLIEDLRRLARAEFVNVRPISGLNAMMLALGALGGPPGSSISTISPDLGGHYATVSLAERLGLVVHPLGGHDSHTLDLEAAARHLTAQRPALVYVDQSICLFPLDVAELVAVVRECSPETLVHVDVSHWMGLVLGGVMPNPLDAGADSFGGSTHKTFPGPQKGFVATRSETLRDRLTATQFYMISSHHFAATVSLGLAVREFEECLLPSRYPERVLELTSAFAAALAQRGIVPECPDRGFSAGHQLWVRTAPLGVDAFAAGDRLGAAGLRVNAFPGLPGVDEPALRIGLNEAARIGLPVERAGRLAEAFVAAFEGRTAPARSALDEVLDGVSLDAATPDAKQLLGWLEDTWATTGGEPT